jgi:hypothetical protein
MKKAFLLLSASVLSLSILAGCEKQATESKEPGPTPAQQDEMDKIANPNAQK